MSELTKIKKVYELEQGEKVYLGKTPCTFKGMDGMYGQFFNDNDEMTLVSCVTLVEVRESEGE